MQITKTVPVTISVNDDDPKLCGMGCDCYCIETEICQRYGRRVDAPRCPECLAEFGMGEGAKQYVLTDEQLWAAIRGLQAGVRECEAECNELADPEMSQQDRDWYAEHLTDLLEVRGGGYASKPPKPAVVPWQDSNIGDVVEIDGRRVRINDADEVSGVVCSVCYFDNHEPCPCCGYSDEMDCSQHPSGCDVYFVEVEE